MESIPGTGPSMFLSKWKTSTAFKAFNSTSIDPIQRNEYMNLIFSIWPSALCRWASRWMVNMCLNLTKLLNFKLGYVCLSAMQINMVHGSIKHKALSIEYTTKIIIHSNPSLVFHISYYQIILYIPETKSGTPVLVSNVISKFIPNMFIIRI